MSYTDEELREAVRDQLLPIKVAIDCMFDDLLTTDVAVKVANFQKSYFMALIKAPNAFTREEALELMKSNSFMQRLGDLLDKN